MDDANVVGGGSMGVNNGGGGVGGRGGGRVRSRVGEGRDDGKKKTRSLVYQIRMNEDEAALLDMISYETEDSKADVVRKALKMYFNAKRSSY